MSKRIGLAAALLVSWTSSAFASGGFTIPVSNAAWVTVVGEDGARPDLLVVWRGVAGWSRGRPGNRSGSAGGSGRTYHSSEVIGDITLDVEFDFATRIARIAGHRVSMGSDNVVLVDGIGVRGGSTIVRTLSVDGALSLHPPDIYPLLARSPDVATFIQCDAKVPDPGPLDAMSDWCAPLVAAGAQIAVPPETEVRAALQRYVSLVQKMDHAGIAAMFTPGGEVVNPGRDPIRGPAAIEAFLRQFGAYTVINEAMIPRTTVVDGDYATQTGTYLQRVRDPEGKVLDVSGTFTLDWIRDASGVWRIQRAATAPK